MSVTSSAPGRRAGAGAKGRRPSPWLLLPAAVVLVGAGLFFWQTRSAAPATTTTTATVARGTVTVSASGSGTIQPAHKLDLTFQTAGQVADVAVAVGDVVKAGQPLAKLDTAALELAVQQAEAGLKSAQAKLADAKGEGATEQDVQSAKLALQAAEINLKKVTGGNATAADIRSAQANLASAQAKLAALTSPAPADLSAAQARLTQAQVSLQNTKDSDSAAKTRAQLDLDQAANALTQAQSKYATAKQNWEYVQETGNDPIQPNKTGTSGQSTANKLTDGQRQQYYDAYVQAEASLRNAETSLQQAQVAYDTARQKEANDVAAAEQSAGDAQVQYDALRSPSASAVAQARAAVVQAQAQLDNLRGGGSANDVESAQVQVEQARLALEKLTAPGSASTVAAAEAAVTQAEAQLASAKLDLQHATVSAPFDGVVTAVGVIPGQQASASTAAVSVIDSSALHIDINLSETDAAKVKVGQPVKLTFDALPGQSLAGKVALVAPSATVQQNVVTYLVQVGFDPGKAPVKIGMSATAEIEIEQHANVITVPSRAVQTQGGSQVVMVRPAPGQPPVTVQVETGLTSNGQTEIVSCVDTGAQCLREGDTLVVPAAQRTTTGAGNNRGGFGGPVAVPFGGPGR